MCMAGQRVSLTITGPGPSFFPPFSFLLPPFLLSLIPPYTFLLPLFFPSSFRYFTLIMIRIVLTVALYLWMYVPSRFYLRLYLISVFLVSEDGLAPTNFPLTYNSD